MSGTHFNLLVEHMSPIALTYSVTSSSFIIYTSKYVIRVVLLCCVHGMFILIIPYFAILVLPEKLIIMS